MRHQQFAMKIAYASIFSKTADEAAANLIRLIVKGVCGFDEGVSRWNAVLEDYLNGEDNFVELNRFGASFAVSQWRTILEQIRRELLTYAE